LAIFYAHGKLLLSGEYTVLDGAKALALPTRLGQSLKVDTKKPDNNIVWVALRADGSVWHNSHINLHTERDSKDYVNILLHYILENTPHTFIKEGLINGGFEFETVVEFLPEWGLGTSSTLVSLLSQWSGVDAYKLLEASFGGSGYDIACATAEKPIIFQKKEKGNDIKSVDFYPTYCEHIYFIYLGKKQNSREGIYAYKNIDLGQRCVASDAISSLTDTLLFCANLEQFNFVIEKHEEILSSLLSMPRVQSSIFSDYTFGQIKSLGAWGGDFVLATTDQSQQVTEDYFRAKGLDIIFRYNEIILT